MLKICPDCTKSYSVRATSCIHCGAPNDDLIQQAAEVETEKEQSSWIFIIALLIITFLMFFYGKETRDFVLNVFDAGVVAAIDLHSCDNTRVKNEIKQIFENSHFATQQHLKVVSVQSKSHTTSQGAELSCLSTMTLNNHQKVTYLIDFKVESDKILVEGKPW